jgi:hypothetical protein
MRAPNIADDYKAFDGLLSLQYRSGGPNNVNLTTGRISRSDNETPIHNCLIRQMSDRLVGTVRQIFERGKSVTMDSIAITDTVIEIPVQELTVELAINDTILRYKDGVILTKYTVLAYDLATLETRWRVACRVT